jgi:polar amino acid transport system permease protein
MTALVPLAPPQGPSQPLPGPDDWDWDLARDILPDLAEGMWMTVRITLVSVALAMVLGLVLAIIRRSRWRVIRWPVGAAIDFIRSTPLLVQLYFLFYVLPQWDIVLSGFQAGVIGIGVHYACYTSETYRAGIESVPRGQWEASTALNLGPVTTWRSVVLPQAIPTVIPALGNYLVIAFKDAPLVATITVTEIMGVALDIQSDTFRGVEAFTIAGLLFLAVSIPASALVRLLEKRFGYQRN